MIAPETFLDGKVVLHAGDCLDVLDTLPENSIDACVTDPPYYLPSIAARFGKQGSAPAMGDVYSKSAFAGFNGKPGIVSDVAYRPETWAKVCRVLKPGGHLFAFSAASNFGEMQVAISAGGFGSPRDTILQMIEESEKALAFIDSLTDAQRCAFLELVVERSRIGALLAWVYGTGFPHGKPLAKFLDRKILGDFCDLDELARGAISHTAAFYESRDIALKPAFEPIVMARKPLDGTLADNIARWHTGTLDIDGCGVAGAWPSNVIAGDATSAATLGDRSSFYYSAKADADDRLGSKHPTVKPVDLMQWLARLATTPGQIVIDPFAGTGTTGEAAFREGRRAILAERDTEFCADIRRRMALCLAGPDERKRESIKAKIGDQPFEAGSLFANL